MIECRLTRPPDFEQVDVGSWNICAQSVPDTIWTHAMVLGPTSTALRQLTLFQGKSRTAAGSREESVAPDKAAGNVLEAGAGRRFDVAMSKSLACAGSTAGNDGKGTASIMGSGVKTRVLVRKMAPPG